MAALPYVADLFAPRRRATREVKVGDVGVGGANPIRLQSMTTANTLDTAATVAQVVALADAGCEIVRITAPSLREAENLAAISAEVRARGVDAPLVADIHFTPKAALIAAEHVEKVRINPGNYADKKKFEVREYADAEYAAELERVADRFRPLVRRCRELGRALRIGTNHGSLSDRIMNRFGDTPAGMVESALEFLDVCEDEGYREVVFSMKASNPQVAIQAYRLLAARLAARDGDAPSYPFHVGVTEAGDGEDGRIKSALGIGSLLEDGIGDTIRVSLTEDPVREVPVAAALARRAERAWARPVQAGADPGAPPFDDPYAHVRRATRGLALAPPAGAGSEATSLGAGEPVRVEVDLGAPDADATGQASRVATSLALLADVSCESLLVRADDAAALARAAELAEALSSLGATAPLSVRVPHRLAAEAAASALAHFARVALVFGPDAAPALLADAARHVDAAKLPLEWHAVAPPSQIPACVDLALAAGGGAHGLLFSVADEARVPAVRAVVARLRAAGRGDVPVRLASEADLGDATGVLAAAVEIGAPLCDGIGDLVSVGGAGDPGVATALAYRILQAARQRTTWTEFISCPSCGRTLFDLEETTARVKERTAHLPGVKIAVMGCIVNGPGEMADADFGYVGSGPGVVNLYVGQEVQARHVPEAEAPDRLVDLIRDAGRWTDPA